MARRNVYGAHGRVRLLRSWSVCPPPPPRPRATARCPRAAEAGLGRGSVHPSNYAAPHT